MIHRNGMTLVELLVVLAILALMTTVAVTSSDVFLSQGRYEATARTLTNIQEAVLGPPNARQADGTLISTGFVADVGRWPQVTSADAPGGAPPPAGQFGGPVELTGTPQQSPPSGIAPFALVPCGFDPEVVVPCGWRGPYLRLGVGQTSILDGWGNALNLLTVGGAQAALGNPIWVASSNGAGIGVSSPYAGPLAVNFAPPQNGIVVSGTVSVVDSNGNSVTPPSGDQVVVMLYGPAPSGVPLQLSLPVTMGSGNVGSFGMPSGTPSVYASGFLRAYLVNQSTSAIQTRSAIVQFQQSGVFNLTVLQ